MVPKEICRPAFPDHDFPKISYGLPFPETCKLHNEQHFKACRVYIICSGTLAKTSSHLGDLKQALGDKVAGVRIGMKPHTFMSEVLEIIHDARELDADLIITLGAGSLSDGAKMLAQALGNDVLNEADLMELPTTSNPDLPAKPPKCPIICIPTSLSGGEYSDYAGVTRDSDHQKLQFSKPLKAPSLIILDANLALSTPMNIWLQSGVRAIDHCVESLISVKRDVESDEACEKGLHLLIQGLLSCKVDPSNMSARRDCQLGVNFAMVPLHRHIFPGASHGIGHMLGPLGVGHGETSCILLPAVCKWNYLHDSNVERQRIAAKIFWDIDIARKLFEAKGLEEETSQPDHLIDAVVRALGMPRSLSEVGIGHDKFEALAINSLEDPCLRIDPGKIVRKEQVLEILDLCA